MSDTVSDRYVLNYRELKIICGRLSDKQGVEYGKPGMGGFKMETMYS